MWLLELNYSRESNLLLVVDGRPLTVEVRPAKLQIPTIHIICSSVASCALVVVEVVLLIICIKNRESNEYKQLVKAGLIQR